MAVNALSAGPGSGPTLWTHGTNQYGVHVNASGNIIVSRFNRVTRTLVGTFDLSTVAGNPLSLPLDENDNHEVPAIGVDDQGRIYVAGNNFFDPAGPRMVKSTNVNDITAWTDASSEINADPDASSYSYFNFSPLASGALLLLYRIRVDPIGLDRHGEEHCFRRAAGAWTDLGPITSGEVDTDNAFYRNNTWVDDNGRIHIFGVWKLSSPDIIEDHHSYLRSDDEGTTWQTVGGASLTLPLSVGNAAGIAARTGITFGPADTANLHAGGAAVDADGYPCAIYKDRLTPEQVIVRWNGSAWTTYRTAGLVNGDIALVTYKGDLWSMRGWTGSSVQMRRTSSPFEVIRFGPGAPVSGSGWYAWHDPVALRDHGTVEVVLADPTPTVYTFGEHAGSRVRAYNEVMVPLSIDSTGATDVGAELTTWFATETFPAGTVVKFQPGGTYKVMDASVSLAALSNITIDGNGATLLRDDIIAQPLRHPNVTAYLKSAGATSLTIRNLHVSGVVTNDASEWPTWTGAYELVPASGDYYINDSGGTPQGPLEAPSFFAGTGDAGVYNVALAFEVGFHFDNCVGVLVEDCNLHGMGSDGVYFKGNSINCTVRNVEVRRNGRQGVAIVHGSNFLIDACDIVSTRSAIDLEPLGASEFVEGVEIVGSTLKAQLSCLAAGSTKNVDNVNYHGNTFVLGNPCLASGGPNRAGTRNGWRVANNTGLQTRSVACITLQNTTDFDIDTNTIPGDATPGWAINIEGTVPSTGIVITDNTFTGYTTLVNDTIGGSSWTPTGNTPAS